MSKLGDNKVLDVPKDVDGSSAQQNRFFRNSIMGAFVFGLIFLAAFFSFDVYKYLNRIEASITNQESICLYSQGSRARWYVTECDKIELVPLDLRKRTASGIRYNIEFTAHGRARSEKIVISDPQTPYLVEVGKVSIYAPENTEFALEPVSFDSNIKFASYVYGFGVAGLVFFAFLLSLSVAKSSPSTNRQS